MKILITGAAGQTGLAVIQALKREECEITIHAFATSGGSGIGKTADKLQKYVSGAASVDAKLVRSASEL